jgi:signal peptidase I
MSNSLWNRRLLAAALSMLVIGGGHASLGRLWRGAAWFGAAALAVALMSVVPQAFFAVIAIYVLALVDAVVVPVSRDRALPGSSAVAMYMAYFVGALVAYRLVVMQVLLEAYRIPAGSMQPTLRTGDHIFISKAAYWFGEPGRGDVVVFPNPCMPEKDFIKRIVAVGGDLVELRCGVLYVNHEPVPQELVADRDECAWWEFQAWEGRSWEKMRCSRHSERLGGHRYDVLYAPERPAADRRRNRADEPIEYAHVAADRDFPDLRWGVPELPGCEPHHGALDRSVLGHFVESRPAAAVGQGGVCTPALAYKVSPGYVFVLGDNRDDSSDSRDWGPVPVEDIKGKARLIWYSSGHEGVAWDRIGQPID